MWLIRSTITGRFCILPTTAFLHRRRSRTFCFRPDWVLTDCRRRSREAISLRPASAVRSAANLSCGPRHIGDRTQTLSRTPSLPTYAFLPRRHLPLGERSASSFRDSWPRYANSASQAISATRRQRAFQTGPISGGFSIENVEAGETGPAAFDQIHTAVAGITKHEKRSGLFVTAQFDYGSGTPAALPDENGDETLVRLPSHFTASIYGGIDLFRDKKRNARLQFNVENIGDRVYRIAKESEFTPVQYSPPRFISASIKVRF